ncbi:hypothetical protein [Clostridium estertheticum]|uniref:hypothetical protein n=1 Tax=Clostridium estertheticum TaxID=238834 RepID=UPI001CF1B1D1|nr:hypothetical protein [Clostridium estertheticum]MCB2354351.1 hypothetical protein [Clostridium estertheticum]WAG42530.1 hypothetical protein LL065_07610 [Clostridium estertheticum]
MLWNKIKETNKPYKEIFKEHINNEDSYIQTKETYDYVKGNYDKRIRKKTIDIRVERVSLQKGINNSKVLSVPNYLSFTLLAFTIFINGLITACSHYPTDVIIYITAILVMFLFYVGFSISIDFAIDDRKVIVFKLCLQVLDDIEKDIAEGKLNDINNISEQEVASAIEITCQSNEDPLESINKTEKRRMKKYSKLFAKQFNVKIKNYSADSYDTLIKDIETKYSNMIKVDKNKLFNERIKAQDNIDNCFEMDVSKHFNQFLATLTAFTLAGVGLFKNNDPKYVIIILDIMLAYIALCIISQVVTKAIDSLGNNIIKSYNKICLSILQKIENEGK